MKNRIYMGYVTHTIAQKHTTSHNTHGQKCKHSEIEIESPALFCACRVTSLFERQPSPINIKQPRGKWSCGSETQIWSGLSSTCRTARQKLFNSVISQSASQLLDYPQSVAADDCTAERYGNGLMAVNKQVELTVLHTWPWTDDFCNTKWRSHCFWRWHMHQSQDCVIWIKACRSVS